MNRVSAIIVSYNTPELLKGCYESIRKFYPELHCILVDQSDENSTCFNYVKTRNNYYNTKVLLKKNYGHGPGIKFGIELCKSEYFLLIDSDVVIKKEGVIESMLSLMEKGVYGVGHIMQVNSKGLNVENGIPYLHPHFALIKKEEYLKFKPAINHGAPMLEAMKSCTSLLLDFPVKNYIIHHERGTRKLNPKAFHPKNWDKV